MTYHDAIISTSPSSSIGSECAAYLVTDALGPRKVAWGWEIQGEMMWWEGMGEVGSDMLFEGVDPKLHPPAANLWRIWIIRLGRCS